MDNLSIVFGNKKKYDSVVRRLNSNTREDIDTGCIEWIGKSVANGGYGRMTAGRGVYIRAHRLAYAIKYGVPDAGMYVCHKCDNPLCCNPDHLFLGTAKENTSDMVAKGRMCKPPTHQGETHPNAKLSTQEVFDIRDSRDTLAYLAKKYNVSDKTIWRIKHKIQRSGG